MANSGSSAGVYGLTNAGSYAGASGVFGHVTGGASPGPATPTAITAGVRGLGDTAGPYGAAVLGWEVNNGYGGYFTAGDGGRGVFGKVGSGAGLGYGIEGVSDSTAAGTAGVYGHSNSNATLAAGVRGENTQNGTSTVGVYGSTAYGGAGVYGTAPNGAGIFGQATGTSGANYGVVGATNSPSGFAGVFLGNVYVSGTLAKAAGSFKIDHPLDPAHKYLQHSFVESPDMKDVYDGIVTTNANGFAAVRLPAYFQALNKDFRYQLTVVRRSFAQAIIWKEIAHNRFTIKTNQPNTKVSWQVTGIRHDPYANAHRIQVVVPKAASQQGRYLHPELYGQPASRSLMLKAVSMAEAHAETR